MNVIERIARWVSDHPKRAIGLSLILTVIFMGLSSTVEEELSLESLFPDYPEIEIMNNIQKDFGEEEATIILLRGDSVLTPESFRQTAAITEKLWEDDSVHSALITPKDQAINSLPSMLAYYRLSGQGNPNPTQEDLLKEMHSFSSEKEIKETLKTFLNDQNIPESMKEYALMFLPKNFNKTTPETDKMVIYVSLDASLERKDLEDTELRIENLSEDVEGPNEASIYGFKLLDHYSIEVEKRLVPAFLAALILILIIMAVNFRRISDIAISLSTLFIAIIWTTGFSGLMGWPLNLMTGMVPILILGLGIDFSFHVLMGYRERLAKADNDPKMATHHLLATVGIALALAAVTTFVGFSSNAISDIPSMRYFGFLSGFAIFSIFFLNITYVPALRELLDIRKGVKKSPKKSTESKIKKNGAVKRLSWLIRRPLASGLLLLLVLAVALPGLVIGFNIKASYDPTGEFPSDMEITQAYKTLTTEFEVGTEIISVRINDDLASPTVWQNVQESIDNINNDEYV
ncbi:MAG: MMPL family transporter, partial [Euryarchaeota archaeon]|nr:MMPL family transporter [Euryarchaeota archaeon]